MTTATVRIVMELDYERTGEPERDAIKAEVAELLGCQVSELADARFSRGCVRLEFEVPEELADVFASLFKKASEGSESSEELEAIRRFIARRNTQSVNLVRQVHLALPRQTAAPRAADTRADSTLPLQEIVLVHGWNGTPVSFGVLPAALQKRFACVPYIYQYPSSPTGPSPALSFVARNLRNAILNHTSSRRIAVIAHSMGGVVLRRMLANQLLAGDEIQDRLKLVVFAASPKNGAALANLGKFVSSLSQDQLRDLSPDSGFMVDLNETWREWVRRRVPGVCKVSAIYGMRDKVVSNANAADYDGEAVPLLDKDHGGVVKPTGDDDEIVLTLSRFLVGAGFVPSATAAA